MLLRIVDKGNRKKRKAKKPTKAEQEAEASFLAMQARLDALPKFARTKRSKGLTLKVMPDLAAPAGRASSKKLKSLNVNEIATPGDYRPQGTYVAKPVYTGTKMLGVSVLHKSNGIPVFSDEEIKDISKMRR